MHELFSALGDTTVLLRCLFDMNCSMQFITLSYQAQKQYKCLLIPYLTWLTSVLMQCIAVQCGLCWQLANQANEQNGLVLSQVLSSLCGII